MEIFFSLACEQHFDPFSSGKGWVLGQFVPAIFYKFNLTLFSSYHLYLFQVVCQESKKGETRIFDISKECSEC